MLQVRVAAQNDLAFVHAWAPHSAWEALSDQEKSVTQPQEVVQFAQGLLLALLGNPGSACILIAEITGQPVGYVLGGVAPDTCTGEAQGYLFDLYVVPPLRRQSIGRRLLGAAEAYFARLGLRKAKILTGLHNQAAVHMASTSGFQPEGLVGIKEW